MRAKIFALFLCLGLLPISFTPGAAEENVPSEAGNPVVSHIPRESVGSSVIASVGYSRRRHILEIEFSNHAVYRYLEVPPSIHRELMSAASKARYYVANIKGSYPSIRVRPRVKGQDD